MDFYLNKIDPQLVKVIKEATATNVIHRKNEVPIRKEEKDRESGQDRKKRQRQIKAQIQKLNELADKKQLDIFFALEETNQELWIKVYEKNTDNCIKSFNESEIEDIISRLQNIMGIIVDVKG